MGGFLVMRIMVGLVRDRLRRGEAPDHNDAYDKKAREEPCKFTLHHISGCNRTGVPMVRESRRWSQDVLRRNQCLPDRIRKKFAVYCANKFARQIDLSRMMHPQSRNVDRRC